MKKKLSERTNKAISTFSALVFLLVQANLGYAAEAFSYSSPANFVNRASINEESSLGQLPKSSKNFSIADYDVETGALTSVKQFEVVVHFSNTSKTTDYRLISEIYFNSREQVSYLLDYGQKEIAGRYDFNYRPDGALLRVDLRASNDLSTNVQSATYFKGAKGTEQPSYIVDFDNDGSILAVHSFMFDSRTGALNRVDRKNDVWSNVPLDASFFLTGKLGEEMPAFALTYDPTGRVNGFQDFGFHASGALTDSSSNETSPAVVTMPSDGKTAMDAVSHGALSRIPELSSRIGRNGFEFDLQGILTNIDVRAGPIGDATFLWKGAN